nr:immunoglobulin heavy chain junction region [Macaca mulatta]
CARDNYSGYAYGVGKRFDVW